MDPSTPAAPASGSTDAPNTEETPTRLVFESSDPHDAARAANRVMAGSGVTGYVARITLVTAGAFVVSSDPNDLAAVAAQMVANAAAEVAPARLVVRSSDPSAAARAAARVMAASDAVGYAARIEMSHGGASSAAEPGTNTTTHE